MSFPGSTSRCRQIVEELSGKFLDFRRAFTEGGLSIDEFDSFAPTRRTLRQFITACHDSDAMVRDIFDSGSSGSVAARRKSGRAPAYECALGNG